MCTIIAKNYLPFARTLARSFAEQRPDDRCWVLVIDAAEGYVDGASESFELLTPEDLQIEHFSRMAALYNVLELSTAVKPWLLRYLLEGQGLDRIVYLDPDIRLYDDLSEIDSLLSEHHMVVTPHLTEPMPRDGRKPSETDLLIAGCFNLGFLGLSAHADTDRLLDWWSERLKRDCIVAPERGLFVDQRWIDFAPGLLPSFHVLRDPGYNVAYWNLPSRELTFSRGRYEVDGRPLRFFHFSGYDPDQRGRLSKHQDRIAMRRGSALRRICDEYGDQLEANGWGEASSWPYSWTTLPNGLDLDKATRAAYRQAELEGALEESPFTERGARELLQYLTSPAERGGHAGVNRYLHALWRGRRDLRRDFPELDGVDAARLVSWAEVYGRADIPDVLLPRSSGATLSAHAGVNVAGYFEAVLGMGQLGRQVVEGLRASDVPVAPVGLVAEASARGETLDAEGPRNAPYATNLLCVNADALPGFARTVGPDFFINRYSIGLWAWEVAPFPDRYLDAFDVVDEVWVISRHMARILEPVSPVPVFTAPLPVDVPPFESRSREQLGLPSEGFLFLFSFDYNSVFTRKNPLGVIEAFSRAFEPGSGPRLVIKSIAHERFPERHREVLDAASRHPEVRVLDAVLPRAEKDALTASCDCYVSLHRSEGFGYTMAEAMWLGRPVIATGYSGNLDFMTAENSYLVDWAEAEVGEGAEPYPPEGCWADPDLDHAARLMAEVAGDPGAAAERGRRGRSDIRAGHSRAVAGRVMARRLDRVEGWLGSSPRARGARQPRIADTARVAARVRRGAIEPGPPSRGAEAKLAARKAMLRLIKPFTVHQENVDNEILGAIATLDSGLQSLAASQAQLQRLLTETRAAPAVDGGELELSEHPTAGVVSGYANGGRRASADLRRALAAAVRAPRVESRERAGAMVDLLDGRGAVLTLGPGARDAAEPLEAAGHEHRSGGLGELGEAAEGSLGGVLALELVEELAEQELLELVEAAGRALRPEGVFVLSSANPHSVAALKTFWADPARRRPVFPETLIALLREAGFPSAFVFHPGGVGNVEADRHREPLYAVAASR